MTSFGSNKSKLWNKNDWDRFEKCLPLIWWWWLQLVSWIVAFLAWFCSWNPWFDLFFMLLFKFATFVWEHVSQFVSRNIVNIAMHWFFRVATWVYVKPLRFKFWHLLKAFTFIFGLNLLFNHVYLLFPFWFSVVHWLYLELTSFYWGQMHRLWWGLAGHEIVSTRIVRAELLEEIVGAWLNFLILSLNFKVFG